MTNNQIEGKEEVTDQKRTSVQLLNQGIQETKK